MSELDKQISYRGVANTTKQNDHRNTQKKPSPRHRHSISE